MTNQVRLIVAMTSNGVIGRTWKPCDVCAGRGCFPDPHGYETEPCWACREEGMSTLRGSTGRVSANDIPWRYPEDLKYFKSRTVGFPVIMGRTTKESIPPKFFPLPDRENIVLSTTLPQSSADFTVTRTIEEALETAARLSTETTFVIGGAAVYAAALPYATHLDITFIRKPYEGDVKFPGEPHMILASVPALTVEERVFVLTESRDGDDPDLRFTTWRRA